MVHSTSVLRERRIFGKATSFQMWPSEESSSPKIALLFLFHDMIFSSHCRLQAELAHPRQLWIHLYKWSNLWSHLMKRLLRIIQHNENATLYIIQNLLYDQTIICFRLCRWFPTNSSCHTLTRFHLKICWRFFFCLRKNQSWRCPACFHTDGSKVDKQMTEKKHVGILFGTYTEKFLNKWKDGCVDLVQKRKCHVLTCGLYIEAGRATKLPISDHRNRVHWVFRQLPLQEVSTCYHSEYLHLPWRMVQTQRLNSLFWK